MLGRNLDDIVTELSPEVRKKIEARAAELIAEELALRKRRAQRLAQGGAVHQKN